VSLRRVHLRQWRPTEAAAMLWLLVVAMLLGLVAEVLFGHSFGTSTS